MEKYVDIYSKEILLPLIKGKNESPWVRPGRPWEHLLPKGVPKTLNYPVVPLGEMIDQVTDRFRNNVFVNYIPDDKKYTYSELNYVSDKLAAGLSERFGVKKGKSVAIMTPNRPEYIFSMFGILKTGASFTPIPPMLTAEDAEYIIQNSGIIDTIFVHEWLYPRVENIKEIKNFIIFGEEPKAPNTDNFWDFVKEFKPKSPDIQIDPKEDLAVLIYTSGTTGRPKGVMLTHYNVLSNTLQYAYWLYGFYPDLLPSEMGRRSMLIVIPICHMYGYMMTMLSMYMGMMIVLHDRFDLQQVCELIEEYKITDFPGIPTLITWLANYEDVDKYDLTSLGNILSGSAPIAPEIEHKFEELTGIKVTQGYGLTETSSAVCVNPFWGPSLVKSDSVGIPTQDTDCKIVNIDTGKEVPIEEIGEVCWKGPQVMKGYWKAPELTSKILKEGWLHSGDLGKMDEEGYIYITGRLKDIIKYKGHTIHPDEIEFKLFENPKVLECAVIGVPDPEVGENIKAFIVLKEDQKDKVTEQEIIDWSKEKLGGLKYPRIVEFRNEIPKTSMGKIFRKKLREE